MKTIDIDVHGVQGIGKSTIINKIAKFLSEEYTVIVTETEGGRNALEDVEVFQCKNPAPVAVVRIGVALDD